VLPHDDAEEVKSVVGVDVVSNVDLVCTESVPDFLHGNDDGVFSCVGWLCDALVDPIERPNVRADFTGLDVEVTFFVPSFCIADADRASRV
jgi:hypothetical protein